MRRPISEKNRMEVLVLPRELFRGMDRFSEHRAGSRLKHLADHASWLPLEEAERSRTWVQAIPCALIRNHSKRYLVLRRVRHTRPDLRARVSLLVGGHVDESVQEASFTESL